MPARALFKRLAIIGLLVIFGVAAWEGSRLLWNPPPPPAPGTPVPAPVGKPVEVSRETRPAPPLITAPKPIVASAPMTTPAPVSKPKNVLPTPAAPKLSRPQATPSVPRPSIPAVPVPPVSPPIEEPMEWQGNDTAVTHAGEVVIRNDRQWVHFWSEHRPHEAAPEVDFNRSMVIGLFTGERPADAFTVKIIAIRTLPTTLIVDYHVQEPPPGTFAIGVSVYPYDIKVIPRSPLPVKFNPV